MPVGRLRGKKGKSETTRRKKTGKNKDQTAFWRSARRPLDAQKGEGVKRKSRLAAVRSKEGEEKNELYT